MSELNPELALRIGLAARTLPDTDVKQLMQILIQVVGLPFTPEKFTTLTVKPLLKISKELALPFSKAQWQQVVALLNHGPEERNTTPLPQIESYQNGDMPGSIRVAMASNNGDWMDGHFGSCLRFLIYQISHNQARLIEIRQQHRIDDNEEKNQQRAKLLSDCQLLFTQSIGGPAAAKVIRQNIHPLKIPLQTPCPELVRRVQQMLVAPPPWLAKYAGLTSGYVSHDEEMA